MTDGPDPSDLAGQLVCVAGLGVTGPSAVHALLGLGARVVAVDGRDRERERTVAEELRARGAEVRLGDADRLPADVILVVTSPGWRPDHPLLAEAARRGVPVWGDVELAYRLRPPGQEWLGVTGTNGKTTTVEMLASILRAAGHHAVAAGNVGLPVLEAVLAEPPYAVLAVEVSSFQLHWTSTVEFISGAVLNIAADHLDWHGSLAAYAEDKSLVWRSDWYCVYNADDPLVTELAHRHEDTQSFSSRDGSGASFGVVGNLLVDRGIGTGAEDADIERVPDGGVVLGRLADVPVAGPHNVANALAAAALARSLNSATGGRLEVRPHHVRDGLRAFNPGAHRIAHVETVDGVAYVDDSKATNAHAAAASLRAFPSVVWVAGGLAKGGVFDELVIEAAPRLRGAVLIGADRALIAQALTRHAPQIPVVEVPGPDTVGVDAVAPIAPASALEPAAGTDSGVVRDPAAAMDSVVRAAAELAVPGDTVLLAPACASMDMFTDYAQRGDLFAAAVRRLPGVRAAS